MKQAVDLLLSQSIAGGIVIAAVLLIRAVLLRRASARWVYALSELGYNVDDVCNAGLDFAPFCYGAPAPAGCTRYGS